MVLSENMEEHKKHFIEAFEALRQNQLYLKKSKCVLGQTEFPFLGHWGGQGCIQKDLDKIKAIKDFSPS